MFYEQNFDHDKIHKCTFKFFFNVTFFRSLFWSYSFYTENWSPYQSLWGVGIVTVSLCILFQVID